MVESNLTAMLTFLLVEVGVLEGFFATTKGQILASATWKISGFNDPSTVEACALYFTMRLAIE
jgi:hypothetical protein